MLAVTTLSFDIAVLELLMPLIVGGRVVIVPSDTTVDAWQLSDKFHPPKLPFRSETLTQLRLFGESGDLFLRRGCDRGEWGCRRHRHEGPRGGAAQRWDDARNPPGRAPCL